MEKTVERPVFTLWQTESRERVKAPDDALLLTAVLSGDGYDQIDGLVEDFSAGWCCLLAPGDEMILAPGVGKINGFRLTLPKGDTNIDPDARRLLERFLSAARPGAPARMQLDAPDIARAEAYARLLSDEGERARPYAALPTGHLIVALAAELSRAYLFSRADLAAPDAPRGRGLLAERAADYIRRHYAEDITLSALASEIYTSPSYLSRIFKETRGVTISEYLNQVRLNHARLMLEDTDELIVNIASACGYNYIPYFNQIFRRALNTTPGAYRRAARAEK